MMYYILNGRIKKGGTENLRLFGLSKAFGAISRDIMRTVMYERVIPSNIIKIIRMGHQETCLRPRINGKWRRAENN